MISDKEKLRREAEVPWPGPKPYEEHQWASFFGRRREVDDILELVLTQRLTILSGWSGTGKSSLLRAGVIPALRLNRYRGKDKAYWPVLLLRDWGAEQTGNIDSLFIGELTRAIDLLKAWFPEGELAQRDYEALSGGQGGGRRGEKFEAVLGHILHRREEMGLPGLVVVLDQFEEVLRISRPAAEAACLIVRDLYESGLPIRFLISLRREHLGDLKSLEAVVGGLMDRTYFLDPMTGTQAKEAVLAASGRTVELDEGILSRIFKWLALVRAWDTHGRWGEGDEGAEVRLEKEEADLLVLQALLRELFVGFARRDGESGGRLSVGKEEFSNYVARYYSGPSDGESPEEEGEESRLKVLTLVGGVLGRWIDSAFENAEEAAEESVRTKVFHKHLVELSRRVAIRMAPHLSSGGFKVAQEEGDLVRKAAGDDIWAMGLRNPEIRSRIRIVTEGDDSPEEHLNLEELLEELDPKALKGLQEWDFLSGVAFEERWTRSQAANYLLRAYREAIARLRERNIIRMTRRDEAGHLRTTWELVHDGLGDPFVAWATDRKDSWRDCVAGIVACQGVSPIIVEPAYIKEGEVLSYLRWLGCLIAPASRESLTTLHGLTFRNCDLRGSIFENVQFRGCKFEACVLQGTIFKGCSFEAIGDHSPTEFVECISDSMGIFSSRILSLDLRRAEWSQLTMRDIELAGSLRFVDSTVRLSNFVGVRRVAERGSIRLDDDCRVLYSSGDRDSWGLLTGGGKFFRSGWEDEEER